MVEPETEPEYLEYDVELKDEQKGKDNKIKVG